MKLWPNCGVTFWIQISCLLSALLLLGCTREKAPLGSEENPLKMFFVPSVEVKVLEDSSQKVKKYLEEVTPYKFEMAIPASYVAVVEALGTARADIAALSTFAYILAREKYEAEAKLTVVRYGSTTYQGQIISRKDGPIQKVEDIAGKKMAFVDPASTSGYLLPLKMLREKKIEPSETVFGMKHDTVVSMVYQGQVEVGATFYSPKADGAIQDARRLVLTQYPDVEEKIQILALTDPIPNDAIVFRKDMDPALVDTVMQGLQRYIRSDEGKDALGKLYGITDFQPTTDKEYDGVRQLLSTVGKKPSELL